MDLLKRSELPAWLQQRFGSVGALAAALNTSRQTAHNLFTGRTIPSFETCQKLGLEMVFMETKERGEGDMDNLDDFLTKRKLNVSMEMANQERLRLLREKSSEAWGDLQQATWVRASRLGKIDDASFEWNSYPYLSFGHVAATFSRATLATIIERQSPRFRVVFGRIPFGTYPVEKAPAQKAWDIELSVVGNELVWNVPALGVIGARTEKMAELVIRKLIEYRDKYQAFYAAGSWLTN
jgi:hypothetical protein